MTKAHILTCRFCGVTITGRTKAEAIKLAKAGMWRFVDSATYQPECYACNRESARTWQPGQLTPF